ncbi:phosphoribosylformylglycinamidine cyclo-ligase [Inmirania thermothiophila]|uniref:phosphoribosylformylglycinamidine cyclo-ligase n=1 Tax=Inmirania thermothiophila TaxID=1750597 RepID=UPI000F49EE78|nr:phosphoribosylformylglycinamidine cyclo-ligase [Inmirania thermothiophila]
MSGSTPPRPRGLTYRDAGVDIDAGNRLVDRIRPLAARTRRDEVLDGIGGFAALVRVPLERYREPVLVSGTDGVGTKLLLARTLGRHDTIGIDLVAMCVNDVVVQGAEPLFFLDYFATGRLEVEAAAEVVAGIAHGCELAGCALVGGETAEMPGLYAPGDYDLAGFCVGIAERARLVDGRRVRPGDVVLGLASSGPHANGYSLIRRVLEQSGADLAAPFGASTLGETLLAPTRIYARALLALIAEVEVHAAAHITGGGIPENLPRVLPEDCAAVLDRGAWAWPPVFRWLAEAGGIEEGEMLRTFNCGIGMVVCVAEEEAARAQALLEAAGETVWCLGRIEPRGADGAPVRWRGEAR